MLKIIKKIFFLPLYFYRLYKKNILIKNYFKTNFDKHVLVSYLLVSEKNNYLQHTNKQESLEICKVFQKLGYNVDLINYNSSRKINFSNYDAVFGFGSPFINSFKASKYGHKKIKRIFYGPGMHPRVSNYNTLKRVRDFFTKNNLLLFESSRYIYDDSLIQTYLSDAVVVLGDAKTVDSYKGYYDCPILQLSPFFFKVFDYKDIIKNKDFNDARNNFLFFSGSGMIHKGLDLLLDFFKNNENLNLHICAPLDNEKRFKDFYKKELSELKNIHYYQFIELNSSDFKNVLQKCAFVIFPSCSEGGAVSVITTMGNGGLIPITTIEASIDIEKNGIPIKDLSAESVSESVNVARNMENLKELSASLGELVNEKNNVINYANDLFLFLKNVLKD